MADVTIANVTGTGTAHGVNRIVMISPLVGYVFFIENVGNTFVYQKTTDGGATWGSNVTMGAGVVAVGHAIWWDQWTPGNSGTNILTAYFDVTSDQIVFRSIDTANSDTQSTSVAFSGASAVSGRGSFCAITKSRSGRIYIAYDIDAGAEHGIISSATGNTGSWSSPTTTFVEATIDECLLFPATGTGDNDDIWAIYQDASADSLTIKLWDNSATAEVESASLQTMIENVTDAQGQRGFAGAIRHSDGHLIVVSVSEFDTATADMQVWDVAAVNAGSLTGITQLTAITTNIDDIYYPSVFIAQGSDAIYVAYNGKSDGSEVLGTTTKPYYALSVNGGSSWTKDLAVSEAAAGVVSQVYTPLSGDRFIVVWRVASSLRLSNVNSLVIYRMLATQASFAITAQSATLTYTSAKILSATKVNFTLAAQAANLLFGRKLAAVQQSYAFTFSTTNFLRGKIMSATQASFALTAQSVNFLRTRIMPALQASFALAAQAANLLFGRKLSAAQASYALTPQSASFFRGKLLTAIQASFALTPQATAFLRTRVMPAIQAAFALTPQSANFQRGRIMVALQASFALTAQSANLFRGRLLAAAQASMTLAAQSAVFRLGRVLAAVQAVFALSAQAAALKVGRRLTATQASFAITAQSVGLVYTQVGHFVLAASSRSLAITAQAVNLLRSRVMIATQAGFALTGQAALFHLGKAMAADTASFAITANPSDFLRGRIMIAQQGSYLITGQAADFLRGRVMVADSASFLISANDVAFLSGRVMVADSASFILTFTDTSLISSATKRLFAQTRFLALTFNSAGLFHRRAAFPDIFSDADKTVVVSIPGVVNTTVITKPGARSIRITV